jgi:putative DNA primase/helicase
VSAADIAEALGGRPGGGGFMCPCPVPTHGTGRGDRRPSLSVADGDEALVVHCFGGCDPLDVFAELRRRGLVEDRRPRQLSPACHARQRRPVLAQPDPAALSIWRDARADSVIVAAYLRSRGITIPIPPSLRQGTSLVLGRTPAPQMVAAVQAFDRRIIAVQTLKLTWAGKKAPVTLQRITSGKLYDGAVRLAAAGEVLGLAEGVETALSAQQIAGVPVWAALGSERLPLVRIPDTVRELHVFADNDEPGRRGADKTADRWARRAVVVKLRFPPEGFDDWNDFLQARVVPA